MLGATIQVEMPEDAGLTAYTAILQHLPRHVLRLAALEILRTHTMRVLPLPGEFLATQVVSEWGVVVKWIPKLCAHWKEELARQT